MKTLILSSSGTFFTKNDFNEYLPKNIEDCNIAYIITASKKVEDTDYVDEHRQSMNERGFTYTEIDIDGKNETDLRAELEGYDLLLVEGGNTFFLLKTIRESGFDNIVHEKLEQGIPYLGSSAGAYVAGSSIAMANPAFDRCGVTDITGMNLVPFIIKAHYEPGMLNDIKRIAERITEPVRVLDDRQALLVQNGKVTLLGPGEEITL